MEEIKNTEQNLESTNPALRRAVPNQVTISRATTVASSNTAKVTKIIKRYQNRKLYDTYQSCYVTLDEIAEMIMRGEDVTVIDNRTKKDITSATLTQIIFEKQKRSNTQIPVETLREFIQQGGGTFSGFLTRSMDSDSDMMKRARASMEKSLAQQNTSNLRGAFMVAFRAAEDLKKAVDFKTKDPAASKEALSATQSQLANLSSQLNNIEKLIDAVELRSAT